MTDVAPEHRGVGMAFQNFALFPHMSAFENIASPLRGARRSAAKRQGGRRQGRQAAEDRPCAEPRAARTVERPEAAHRARARAGRRRRRMLLLDDPLRNVDAKLRFEMRLELPRLLRQLGRDGALRDAGLQGGDGARRPHRGAVATAASCRSARPSEIYRAPADDRDRAAVRRSDHQPRSTSSRRDDAARVVAMSAAPTSRSISAAPTTRGRPRLRDRHAAGGAVASSSAGRRAPSRSTVEAVTPLNERTVTLLRTVRGREILASRPAGDAGSGGGHARPCAPFDAERRPPVRPRDGAAHRAAASH